MFNTTSIAIGTLILYLSTFIAFAVLRITTGISIQRVGYFSLRRIAYAPRGGIWVSARGLGLSIHRPTHTQPTWITIRVTELEITVDPAAADRERGRHNSAEISSSLSVDGQGPFPAAEGQLWEKVTRLHNHVRWLRMIDVMALKTSLHILKVGQIHIETFYMTVDSRKTLDRKLNDPSGDEQPLEWTFAIKSILLTVNGSEPTEVLDDLRLNIHGNLSLKGLRDTSIALRIGKLHIPCEDIIHLSKKLQRIKAKVEAFELDEKELGTQHATLVPTVSPNELAISLLRGIQEIQVALTLFRLSKEITPLAHSPVYLNVVTHEVGIDLHRLDQKSPAHRTYFSRKDGAHQALIAAISLSLTLDNGAGDSNKLLYIPMVTTTVKTTLSSKTIASSGNKDAAELNAITLFGDLVMTSPSIDLGPENLAQLLALSQSSASPASSTGSNHGLISRSLPKASIKLSVHEPVIRLLLPNCGAGIDISDDYDMLICSVASITSDIESSYSSVGELQYAMSSSLRIASHRLYYQTSLGMKHNLLTTESLELQIHLTGTPEIFVVISGNLKTFSVHMVGHQVGVGVQRIMKQFRKAIQPKKLPSSPHLIPPNFLRRLPPWLLHFHLEGSDSSVEVGGVDHQISTNSRGFAMQLEYWNAEYTVRKGEQQRYSRPRSMSASTTSDDPILKVLPSREKSQTHSITDGRHLIGHGRGFKGFVVESVEAWEEQPFLSLPLLEVALSTSSDPQGSVFHINSSVKALYFHYSLYRHYSVGVAIAAIKDALAVPPQDSETLSTSSHRDDNLPPDHIINSHVRQGSETPAELTIIDVKSSLIQVKASMPADPPLMLQVYDLTAGSHRPSAPFLKARVMRLNAKAPQLKDVWARIVSINNFRVDSRESYRNQDNSFADQKSFEVFTDFIRLAVPRHFIMFKIFDNIINTSKASAQLYHRFRTRTNEYILRKGPVAPVEVPRVSLRSKVLLFELEDDPFEWKLSNIYRVGLVEQKQRLAREDVFKLKVKRLEDRTMFQESKTRPQTTNAYPDLPNASDLPNTSEVPKTSDHPSKGTDKNSRRWSTSRGGRRQSIRYDPEGICHLSNESKVSAREVWVKLQQHNTRSWKKMIDRSMQHQSAAVKDNRNLFLGADEPPDDVDIVEIVLGTPDRPGLMSTLISDLHLIVDRPSFPLGEYPKFLHRIGKGMPFDMEYALLIPMGLQLDMGEVRVTLRDYPLDLLHIPANRVGQSPRLPGSSMRTDFVIAEEFQGEQSIRNIMVDIIKPNFATNGEKSPGLSIDVRRTVSPVKTYSDINLDVNTSSPTMISWGTSYSPVIQDMMMIIEGFTKPEIDPSDQVGFWDKIRLGQHSRIKLSWKEDGDVHFGMKGSRDPYLITGYGAGFVMCWRNAVRFAIHETDDPKRFLTVTSGEYVLAVPDYSLQALDAVETTHDTENISPNNSQRSTTVFKKVIMKLSGKVRWLAGLVFEQKSASGEPSFTFSPHYDVVLKNPLYMSCAEREDYDAFRGFRSHKIHLSIAVTAPFDRDWTAHELIPSTSHNTIHLSPRFFTHFFNWWSLFSGVMSLPIRHGSLWPGVDKASKNFGSHLATIKYALLLSPLFLAHIYKHKDAEEYAQELVSATGLKIRLDSFTLDMHQRREQPETRVEGTEGKTKIGGMRITQAQIDFISADLRAVSANIGGTSAEDLEKATDETLSSYQEISPSVDTSRFTIPDCDLRWIDMDDFVELGWILPSELNPKTQILPLAFAPRFTYLRDTDRDHLHSGNGFKISPFSAEQTHFCVMTRDNDPRRVQIDLLKARLQDVDKHLESHRRTVWEQELSVVTDVDQDKALKEHLNLLAGQGEMMQHKRASIKAELDHLVKQLAGQYSPSDNENVRPSHASSEAMHSHMASEMKRLYSSPNDELAEDFDNRFIVHNAQLKWNNSLRNIVLRYIHQVTQRRGFIYYLSRQAIRFIIDVMNEQSKADKRQTESENKHPSPSQKELPIPATDKDSDMSLEDRISQLLNDEKQFVDAYSPESAEVLHRPATSDHGDGISDKFTAQNVYQLRLVAPQIQLQSEKKSSSVVVITSKHMQLNIVSIKEKDRVGDQVSGLVQQRFALDMDGAQFFVTNRKELHQYLYLYSENRYGNAPGSSWPPWVSLEVIFDFSLNSFGFSRVIQKTSASLRYNKYNTLRLKCNEAVESGEPVEKQSSDQAESRIDQLWLDFPKVHAICDSAQYSSIYTIVLDLLLYSEPLEKIRSKRLEKIMLASDFSDLRGAPEMAENLQERIRQLEEIKNYFQVHANVLDRQGWQDRISLERDLANCEDELFFIMKAITASERKNDNRNAPQSIGLVRWSLRAMEVALYLMTEVSEPLLEFQLKNAIYERTDNNDGSNHNTIEVDHVHGLNLLSNALYPELIGPYFDDSRRGGQGRDDKMLRTKWHMLEPIAGIPVLDDFEVKLSPLKIQLEKESGRKIFEYILPGVDSDDTESDSFSPLVVKNVLPLDGGGNFEDQEGHNADSGRPSNVDISKDDISATTTPGGLMHRFKPFSASNKSKPKGLGPDAQVKQHSHSRFFQHPNRSQSSASQPTSPQAPTKHPSVESLQIPKRQGTSASSTNLSNLSGGNDIAKQQGLTRSSCKVPTDRDDKHDKHEKDKKYEKDKKDKGSDDLTQMLSRASNYMTLARVKISSVVLCLSYKGKGQRNIEDVHNFVFRIPVLEYRNKTWSNADLALRLKKDVIRALISHTGSIISNKFSHHSPEKSQSRRLRDLANVSQVLPDTESLYNASDSMSTLSASMHDVLNRYPEQDFTLTLPSRTSSTSSSASSVQNSATANDGSPELQSKADGTNDVHDELNGTSKDTSTSRLMAERHHFRSREHILDDTEMM